MLNKNSPIFFLFVLVTLLLDNLAFAKESSFGTVLMYHRFGESKFPSTNIEVSTFRSHLEFLKKESYNVLPLSELIKFLKEKKELPEKSVFITIDDGFKSFYRNAFPLLKEFDFPFTVFITSKNVSSDLASNFMSWKMLSEIKKHKGEIHNHTSDHSNLNKLSENEIINNVNNANNLIQEKLGFKSDIFSFPYGESNLANEKIIERLGFKIAFSQHSSHVFRGENLMRLPRFSFNEEFGSLERFQMILKSKPLVVYDVTPKDTFLDKSLIGIGFSTSHSIDEINCYHSNSIKLEIFRIKPGRIEIRFFDPAKKGRNRINCTSRNSNNELLWFGRILIN